MILIFGPAGAGKSMQGQILAARHGWRWLSAGQLLRDTRDPELMAEMRVGKLVPNGKVNEIMNDAIMRASNIDQVVLDGFPRALEQAKWLLDSQPTHGRSIGAVIVLDVPKMELMKRLEVRGRIDDTFEAIDRRLEIYREETDPILDYFATKNIKVIHVDGVGTVGQIHDRITGELEACKLV
jgi:adenylate kinase